MLNPYESPLYAHQREDVRLSPSRNDEPPLWWIHHSRTRATALLLSASGALGAPIAAIFPLLWPGFLLWFGWLGIAAGSRTIDQPLFWFFSFTWHVIQLVAAGLFTIFFWEIARNDWVWHYWLGHSLLAVVLSAVLAARRNSPQENGH
ncbi:hypothetical protein ETAA8_31140 [Anatilimnocola aggregata]|uniref:Uncharacterized protein n=1 Tax=Anatilimnocola aggregata TaxID=2528021 RepID=A0A517YD19_9BACT|nr:hypothetical protein [Anatilimnocola aggregata]QDU28022.1 hypothetical protein ETAA8_31140 [Anatilimnocola aggregata]